MATHARVLQHQPPAEVPEWSKSTRPWARAMVIGPPREVTDGSIGSVEMLVDDADIATRGRVFFGYVTITPEAAQEMVEHGGVVEIGFWTPQLIPWSHHVYANLAEDVEEGQ